MNRSQFTNWLCRQLTKSCKGKAPKLPRDRKPGPPFTVLDEQQAQLQKMMAGMKVAQHHALHALDFTAKASSACCLCEELYFNKHAHSECLVHMDAILNLSGQAPTSEAYAA